MTQGRGRLLRSFAWLALVALALRPVTVVDRAAEWCVAPFRLVAEVVTPLALVRGGEVRAAESLLARRTLVEQETSAELVADLARFALPADPALLFQRRALVGEVLGRESASRDRLRVLVSDARGVTVGLPVASGDAYVGRVAELLPLRGEREREVVVELATARGAFVGARVEDGPGGRAVQMTVGEVIALPGSRGVHLGVQNPSDRDLAAGLARVHEPLAIAGVDATFARLADGLVLGEIERHASGGTHWTVRPALDYVDGLFQVAILAPEDPALGPPPLPKPVSDDGRWLRARPLGFAAPTAGRATVGIARGTLAGVREGAAVTFGARLMGRVERAGPVSSSVSLLGDPGLSLVAAARFEGEVEPRVLGRLVCLGRAPEDGAVLFRWHRRADLGLAPGPDGTRRATLVTGSGEPGLRAGFHLGPADVPVGPDAGPRPVVRLHIDVEPSRVRSLWVRVASDERRVPGMDAEDAR